LLKNHALGFGSCQIVLYIAPKNSYLNIKYRPQRLAFARKHLHLTEKDWSKVIWNSKSSFEIEKNS